MENSPHLDPPIVNEPEAIARRRLSPIALELLAELENCVGAINPTDLGGISLEIWNKRLKAATKSAGKAIDKALGQEGVAP